KAPPCSPCCVNSEDGSRNSINNFTALLAGRAASSAAGSFWTSTTAAAPTGMNYTENNNLARNATNYVASALHNQAATSASIGSILSEDGGHVATSISTPA
ncbi:unnamed protein product, partial [Amoebophrya sp. A120]